MGAWMQGIAAWRWIKKTYLCAYVIWTQGRRIGLAGLYGLDSGGSVEVSLLVADGERGKGYGRESSGLLVARLGGQRAIHRLRVRVDPSEPKVLRFWQEAGFRVAATAPDCTTLVFRLVGTADLRYTGIMERER
jgi:RimJ/RimL family protein N-acetyltransferase